MHHNYTRQRQGRDFSITNYLHHAEMCAEGNCNYPDGALGNNDPKDDTAKRQSILARLEQSKKDIERNATPIDGCEPPERTR